MTTEGLLPRDFYPAVKIPYVTPPQGVILMKPNTIHWLESYYMGATTFVIDRFLLKLTTCQ